MKFKIKKHMILLWLYFLVFISIQGVQTDIISFHCNDAIIERVTTRAEFSAKLRVRTDSGVKNQYIEFKELKGYEESNFIKVENICIMGNNSNYIKFLKDKDGNLKDTLEFTIKGNLVFYWDKAKDKWLKQVRLGKVYYRLDQNSKEVGTVDIRLDNLNIISILRVNIKKNMDFGTIVAGQKADTREALRSSAQLEIEGASGTKVKVTIPQTTEIKNRLGDSLLVNLRFRDSYKSKNESCYKSITKEILSKNLRGNIGKTDLIEIDGSIATKRESLGNYKGVFTVRVEYED